MKAKITRNGRLAYIETETGQKAVVPWENICNIIKRFGLIAEVIGNEKLDCINDSVKEGEVELDVEPEGYDEEES
ncbi:MAG: hypothetical protein RXQ93_06715 [Caldisphaera sp.]|jgi:hypothetical protein|uniref:hypothetical protein n=1 Tax=Caldisphaera sp. TaxID=2060322 RepID=UPI00397A8F5B